ncbi:MAG: Acetyltransferase [uncultured Quadrisphaera sp.]|uniref:Acetyltransferase n=1 Tax=uncultured Quadrisphaera sp. TaxID=904978 RepID=A0A6J4PBX3_9ACTN|nr:MAG: Acetyltransferase [uncultured Quadrisphaera sp.]
MTPVPVVRPYRPEDRAAVRDVCVRTGDAGGDATGSYPDDGLLPDVYADPYLHLHPELALVLDDGRRAVGYVVGTADTAAFVEAYRRTWLPLVADRHPPPAPLPTDAGAAAASPRYERLLHELHHPERMLEAGPAVLAAHPAHLHVDLLPAHQGAGHGRALVEAFCRLAAQAGAPGVHVGVDPANSRALRFYPRVGFVPLTVAGSGGGALLGRPLP